jgi:4-coumarate--CoA ligase
MLLYLRFCVLAAELDRTTGVPKGVEITHHNLIADALGVIYTAHLAPLLRQLPHRQLGILPMYHAYGQTTYVITSPSLGMSVYIMPKFDFLQFLKYVET